MEELSQEYAQSAQMVYRRMVELRQQEGRCKSPEERRQLRRRILALQPLYRDTREISVITKNYYRRRSKQHESTSND